jgi:hypothetical protein
MGQDTPGAGRMSRRENTKQFIPHPLRRHACEQRSIPADPADRRRFDGQFEFARQTDAAKRPNRILHDGTFPTHSQDFPLKILRSASGIEETQWAEQRDRQGIDGKVTGGQVVLNIGCAQSGKIEGPPLAVRLGPDNSSGIPGSIKFVIGCPQVVGDPPT